MKTLLIAILLISAQSFAAECTTETGKSEAKEKLVISTEVPSNLKGATIIVRNADGTETLVPAEKFKVVPRKQQFIVTHTERNTVTTCDVPAAKIRRNRISVLGGYGAKSGLDTSVSGSTATVKDRFGFVGGLQYQHLLPLLNDRLSVGVQGQTNKTGSLIIGLDF